MSTDDRTAPPSRLHFGVPIFAGWDAAADRAVTPRDVASVALWPAQAAGGASGVTSPGCHALGDGNSAAWSNDRGLILSGSYGRVELSPVEWANLLTFLQYHRNKTARALYTIAQDVPIVDAVARARGQRRERYAGEQTR